jgi:8-oxo-dGTP pyrophosphatase MutT (NUDIX family)
VTLRRSGDGFLRCRDGQARWGLFGAAGVVFVTGLDRAAPLVLLQLRSPWSHGGGTWSCPGGALDEGEDPLEGALREAWEEIGPLPDVEVVGSYLFEPSDDWRYTTFVVNCTESFATDPNFESEAMVWTALDEVAGLPLHPGFAAAWPHLEQIIIGAR